MLTTAIHLSMKRINIAIVTIVVSGLITPCQALDFASTASNTTSLTISTNNCLQCQYLIPNQTQLTPQNQLHNFDSQFNLQQLTSQESSLLPVTLSSWVTADGSYLQGFVKTPQSANRHLYPEAQNPSPSNDNVKMGFEQLEYIKLSANRTPLFGTSYVTKLNYRFSPSWSGWVKGEVSTTDTTDVNVASNQFAFQTHEERYAKLNDFNEHKLIVHAGYNHDRILIGLDFYQIEEDYDPSLTASTQASYQGVNIAGLFPISENLSLNYYLDKKWQMLSILENPFISNIKRSDSLISDASTMLGASINYQNVMTERLNLGLDYRYSDGGYEIERLETAANYSLDAVNHKHNLNAYAKYQFGNSLKLRFDWLIEKSHSSHWQYQNPNSEMSPSQLKRNEINQENNAQFLGLTLSYQM
ncbi:MtrB/PioB family outer membrane beta-barrel protein [Shewanella acanthi]|uniref:MtrB/PioB family outer membrane beta-barrel protein n=1 Tax=Shewanella acanthi TaxID=2864212 RepID=UPI001C661A9A|nr:MtrB/PioB family outer membrane beta-barrel protein [Shewanella acanthi]QYJ77725.1 MtrB/PioB family outer membrane beta-barrel protein [Shewanella acanthi]